MTKQIGTETSPVFVWIAGSRQYLWLWGRSGRQKACESMKPITLSGPTKD